MSRRGVLVLVLSWAAVLGVVRLAVAPPEHCTPVTVDDARTAAEAAVGWFSANQLPDGRFVYEYDRVEDRVDRRVHITRHAGSVMSLHQAAAAGIEGAAELAEAGSQWTVDGAARRHGWAAARAPGEPTLRVGATALTVAGLAIHQLHTGDDRFSSDMERMGRFLVAMVEPSGAVSAFYDLNDDVPARGQHSVYFTGETYWALALLDRADPAGGWGVPAARIGRYLATERDEVEDRFPPVSDHWAAYGLSEEAPGRDQDRLDFARRLAEIFSVEVRVESQRQGQGISRLFRPGHAMGGGLGTVGEGMGSLWRVAGEEPDLADIRPAIGERVRCVAGLLVDRQVTTDEADAHPRPERVLGAWFKDDTSREDDQQHALSALLLAEEALAEGGGEGHGSGDDGLARTLWMVLIGAAAANPRRIRRLAAGVPAHGVTLAAVVGGALLVVVALASPAVLRAADVSPPTALVAAGAVVGGTVVVDALRRGAPGRHVEAGTTPVVVVPGLVRPATVLLTAAVAAHAAVWSGVVVAVMIAAVGLTGLVRWRREPLWSGAAVATLVIVAGVLGAFDLIVDGVLGV